MPSHPLTNFEIQKYYQNDTQLSSKKEPEFDGAYSKNNLPKIKDGAYVINLDEYKSIGTHWIALYLNDKNVTYFVSFRIEHILKEIKKFIGNKNIIIKIYRVQAYNSIMCGYFALDLLILR